MKTAAAMPDPDEPSGVWFTPVRVMTLPDGSTLLKPGKPVHRASANQTSKLTGVSPKNLRSLAEAGFIRRAMPTPGSTLYYPGEVEAFIAQTEADPNFWNRVRTAAYIRCARLRDKRRQKPDTEQ